MAILQLSRITHRKGLSENLPQLAGAELGWVLDDRRLFIGNGTIEDGAPIIGNTEILTEHSNILDIAATYTYKGTAAGYIVSTGVNDEDIVRSLQDKFDEVASVKDFGAVGDGIADDTDAINRALFELFCRETNTRVRRSLYFPAGTYKITDIIKIPPHAKIYGEGMTSSILSYEVKSVQTFSGEDGPSYTLDSEALSALIDHTLVVKVDGVKQLLGTDYTYSSPIITFTTTLSPTAVVTANTLATEVMTTSDNEHKIGANIGGGAELPTGIEVNSIAVNSTEDIDVLVLDSVTNSIFDSMTLNGAHLDDALNAGNGSSAIKIAASAAPCSNVTMNKVLLSNTGFAITVADEARGIIFENGSMNQHFKGAVVGGVLGDTGPTGVVITRTIMDNIAGEGILFDDAPLNISAYNIFYNVGNSFDDSGSLTAPTAPIVHMQGENSVSIGDLFLRSDEQVEAKPQFPRVLLEGNGGIAFEGSRAIKLGSYERAVGLEATLLNNTTGGQVFELTSTLENSFKVDYTIKRNNETRMGFIYVSNNSSSVTFNDEYTETADLGVQLDVVDGTGANSALEFTTTSGTDATISYSVARLD